MKRLQNQTFQKTMRLTALIYDDAKTNVLTNDANKKEEQEKLKPIITRPRIVT